MHLGEIQSKGQQVVGPGSIHPNGNRYELINDAPIQKISKADLLKIFDGLVLTGINDPAEEPRRSAERRRSAGGSSLGDLIPIDAVAWPKAIKERAGSEVIGTHPLHGSKNGKNFSINTAKNCWHCFHGGHNSGGGPLEWIAVEAGLISCQDAKPGCLDDKETFKKVLQIARDRGFDIPAPNHTKELWDVSEAEAEALYNAVRDDLKPGMSQEELDNFKLPDGPKFSINLPPDHFITRFIGYGTAISDAYRVYWFMAAFFILGVVADKKLMFKTSMATFYLNVWIYLLGDSSLARKTTAVQKAFDMLKAVLGARFANACVPNTFSPEAFTEHMSNYQHAPWIRDEAAGVLSIMQKDYMRGFKDDLMQLFDCHPITRMLRTKKSGEKSRFNVDDPYLNLFFASTGAALGYNLDLIDKETGFLARFLFAYPRDEKENYMPLDKGAAIHSELEEICISQLSAIAAKIDAIPSCIDMTHSPNARAYYNAWQETRDKEAAALKDGYSSQIFSRLNPTVMKLAMAFEMGSSDFDPTRPIREEYFIEACRLVDEYFMPTTRAVYDTIGTANKDNQIEKIALYLSRHGGHATRKELMRDVKIKSKEMTDYLLSMNECEMTETRNVYNPVTKRNTSVIFLKDHKVVKVGKVVKVERVEKVENYINDPDLPEENTLPTSSTFSTLPTLSTFHEERVECKDVEEVEDTPPASGPHPRKEDPDRERFKAGMKKRHCLQCGEHFSYDLGIHWQGGYICARCHREGPPAATIEPPIVDAQIKLSEVASAN